MVDKPHVDKVHEEKGVEWKRPSLAETCQKLQANGYQYASAGDVRRLMEEIQRLKRLVNAVYFESVLDNPPEPNEALKKLMRT